MIRFILVTFLFLGWGFYELSGGSDYAPEVAAVIASAASDAVVSPSEAAAATPQVTRSVDATLGSLAVPERLTQPLIAAPAADSVSAEIDAIIEEVAAADPAFTADLREVAGTRVNMRAGPGTDYGVVTTLNAGTQAEVVETDPSGWVRLRVLDSGIEGWIAARLLTPVNG